MTSRTWHANSQIATRPNGRALHDRPEQMTATPTPAGQRSATRVVFPEPGRVELEEVIVDLRELGPHELVVQACRSVISPGTELAHYRGDSLVGLDPPAQRPHQPFHPGYAMAGTVLAAGPDSGFVAGTSVLSHTPHQSVVRFDPRQHVCLPLPAGIDLDIAPFARLGQIGGISLQLTAARPGDTVAVIGLGPVGNLVAQLAQGSGYRVVSVEPSPGRRELARSTGLSTVVAPEEAGDAVAPAGANLVLECSGSQHAVLLATEICARHGEVMIVGAPWRREPEVAASSVVAGVFERFLSLRSGWEWQVPLYGQGRSVAGCTRWVFERLAAGALTTEPLVSGTITPDEAHAAYGVLDREPDRHLTFLFDWEST
jgi:threonine dehydrogenase-like Zn-dependent dehydrogenase